MLKKNTSHSGLTMIELLIVISIIATLAMVFLFGSRIQINRARDADRKSDLQRLKIAFEDYYNDNNCYPPATIVDSCDSGDLEPYLAKIPCDPTSREPYLYLPASGGICTGYRLFTQLQDVNDPSITDVGCSGATACGVGPGFNFGVSAGVALVSESEATGGEEEGEITPPADPSNYQGTWACPPGEQQCNQYGTLTNVYERGCPFSFADGTCDGRCANPAFRCAE